MSFAAILSATRATADSLSMRAGLHFAGQSLVEFQARQAARAGANRILILINVVTPALSQAVDRLGADGITVTLVRDMVAMMRSAPRDADIVLIGDGIVLAQSWIDQLGSSAIDTLLVTDDSRASEAFERIDAGQRWGGALRVGPATLFDTLDMIGDWDLALTLVRRAIQRGARRITISQEDLLEGRVAIVQTQQQADVAARAAMVAAPGPAVRAGGLERLAFAPLARRLAPSLMRLQVSAPHVRVSGIVLAAIALVPVELAWPMTGFLLLMGAILLSAIADRVDEIALRPRPRGGIALITPAMALLGIALSGRTVVAGYLAVLLAIMASAVATGRTHHLPGWQVMTAGTALLILLLAHLAGIAALGFHAAMLAALASVALILLRRRE